MSERETETEAHEALREVFDPETGLNLIDLGLIYAVRLDPQDNGLHVRMTFTTPACPAGEMISEGVQRRLAMVPGVAYVEVEVTFDPPWTPQRISDDGRAQLGW